MSFIDAAKQIVASPSMVQSVLFYNLSEQLEESNVESDMEQFAHLRKGNRFFTSKNGIRRTCDIRQQESNSILSIQTPKGFVGDSIASTKSRKESKDIATNALKCFNAQMSSSLTPSHPVHEVKHANQTTGRFLQRNLLECAIQTEENHNSHVQAVCRACIDTPDGLIGDSISSVGRSGDLSEYM